MEVLLRCTLPDLPGQLATLAGAIGEAGGDIQAVTVVESRDGVALDDLWVVTQDLATIREHIATLDGVRLVHAGPSRGQPGDAVTRLAMGVEALLTGAMTLDHAVRVLVGGLLHASSAELRPAEEVTAVRDRRVLHLRFGDEVLVLTREYRFAEAEAERAATVLQTCWEAAMVAAHAEA